MRNLSPLTGKPVLFVANVDEGDDAVPAVVADHAAAAGAGAVAISSRIEAELSELDDEEADVMREEMGVGASGLQRVVAGAFGLLDLIAFFTAGEDKPAQSWHLRRGLSRPGTPRARSTPTSSAASSAPRSSAGRRSSTRAATPARATAARCGSRAATTRWPTAT